MNELRKDYILDKYVLYCAARIKRPDQFKKRSVKKKINCFFCQGNEHMTSPEIGRIKKGNTWNIRWFSNSFPIIENEEKNVRDRPFLSSNPLFGRHEIIVETPKDKIHLADLSVKNLTQVFEVYNSRIEELSAIKNIKYVLVFKNSGVDAGCSIAHSHSQVIALNTIPPNIKEETKRSIRYNKCLYCKILKIESKSKRKVFENKSVLAFTPYASECEYEIWLFPKRHVDKLNDLKPTELTDMAKILKKIFQKLKKNKFHYNMVLHYSPKKSNMHFHIEIKPRLTSRAGFELGSGIITNPVFPETAAKFYKSLTI
ncbi:MAG: galactose-1-phosphate uridylyltransferase [Nanoarchaeota archaeon]